MKRQARQAASATWTKIALAACKTLAISPLVPFRRVIVKGRLDGSELSLPVSGLLGLVCEGISLTT